MDDAPQQAPIRWNPRVPRHKIRALYESQARGLLDEELLDSVALTIFLRCQSIMDVAAAGSGQVKCHGCGTIIQLPEGFRRGRNRKSIFPIQCPSCPWRTTWGAYFRSYQKKQLVPGGAEPFLREYLAGFDSARTPAQKMVLIDTLIHRFHWWNVENPLRPSGVCVIEGDCSQIMELIEHLAYGDNPPPEMAENRRLWMEKAVGAKKFWGMAESV